VRGVVGTVSGKAAVAPCGHPGVHVTANYVQCPVCDRVPKSDGVPAMVKDRTTRPICSHCGSDHVEIYAGMMSDGRDLYHCHKCLRAFTVPTRS
jgi:transposase-like protein